MLLRKRNHKSLASEVPFIFKPIKVQPLQFHSSYSEAFPPLTHLRIRHVCCVEMKLSFADHALHSIEWNSWSPCDYAPQTCVWNCSDVDVEAAAAADSLRRVCPPWTPTVV